MRDALELNSRGRHPLAMYAAGLAAECMLRAYYAPDQPLDERHDVVELLKGCELERLGDAARGRLRGPVQTVHLLWHSLYRFADEAWVRAHIKRIHQDRRGVHKDADFLKVRCRDLLDASAEVVTVGEERWTQT